MIKIISSVINSFKFAFSGIRFALKTQKNLRIHIFVALIVFILAILLNVTNVELSLIILTTTMVIVVEVINTSIETIVDLVSPDYQPLAKQAKDLGAASVLITAIGAIVVGIVILGDDLFNRLF